MFRAITLGCFTILCAFQAYGQEVRLQFTDEPLSAVLGQLHEQYEIQFSFGPEVISSCRVTMNAVYDSIDDAVEALTKPCKLSVEKLDDVYIIYVPKDGTKQSKSLHQRWLSATITDVENGETLPFTTVQFNGMGLVSDVNGRLTYRSEDSTTRIVISHLGYQNLDTLVYGSGNYHFKLKALTTQLSAVEINTETFGSKVAEGSTRNPRIVKLNHKVAAFQPGSSDNTLFNVLRLQPGILAAGEQTKDFIVQGAYRGQSQILFDGITLFDVSSYNDHIGAVNPLMVKDIEVHKGGFSAEIGDRVGGVVNITGTEGGKDQLHANLRLNNQTVSGLVSVPLHKGAALQAAFRRSYYQLYEPLELDFLYSDILYHSFTDLNLKYSGRFQKGHSLDISFIGFRDKNKLSYDEKGLEKNYEAFSFLENQQLGGSIRFGKLWAKAGITNVSIAISDLETQVDNTWIYVDKRSKEVFSRKASNMNAVSERSVKVDHIVPTGKRQSIKFGMAWIQNSTRDSQSFSKSPQEKSVFNRMSFYTTDAISVNKRWSVCPEFRADLLPVEGKFYIQPRFSTSWEIMEGLRLGAAWGIYRQYLSNDLFIDGLGNTNFNWTIYSGTEENVARSVHQILSAQYQKGAVTLQVEGFRKNISDLSRWKTDNTGARFIRYTGVGRAYGIEATVKRKAKNLETWATYTLSKAEEQFRAGRLPGVYVRAPQDQRHEIKAAAVLQVRSYVFSFNYVYGSGFAISNERWTDRAYSRLDGALLYKTSRKKLKLETGISVLNVLNRKNVRPNYLAVFSSKSSGIQIGTLFTPSVFVNIGF